MESKYKIKVLDEYSNSENIWKLVNIKIEDISKKKLLLDLMRENNVKGFIEFLNKGSVIKLEKNFNGILIYES
jgi:hypothetical protein